MANCPCGSGVDFDRCCAPLLAGQPAPTAEALMRSRYTAYVKGDLDYIERSCLPEALADFDRADMERSLPGMQWLGLTINNVAEGGVDDKTGQVDFTFSYKSGGKDFSQREIATFCRSKEDAWLYQDSNVNPKSSPVHVVQIGRNDPCLCGSGKKYKKCCGAA